MLISDMSDDDFKFLIQERLGDLRSVGLVDYALILSEKLPNGDYRNRIVSSLPTEVLPQFFLDNVKSLIDSIKLENGDWSDDHNDRS